jgi:hypothetical protein
MSPIAEFPPQKEVEVALGVAKVVFGEKGGNYSVVPSGIIFSAKGVVVANLMHEYTGDISTLYCNEEIARKLEKTDEFKKTGLIFQELQKKR